jgi:hypothetical protein
MKNRITLKLASAALLLGAPLAQAFTYVAGDVNLGGIGYAGYVTVGATGSGSVSDHTGAWSWEDQGIAPGGGEGWTHTSRWIALNVTDATWLTLTLDRDATVPFLGSGNVGGFAAVDHMYPSFTLWQNWDNNAMTPAAALALGYDPLSPPEDHHTYTNTSNVIWAENLSYLDHTSNSTLTSVSDSWFLPAGQYTLVFGSNSPSLTNPPRQGYRASFSTSPIPEPGRVAFLALASFGFCLRRRRR